MADTSRVIVYSAQDAFLFELAPDEVFGLTLTEEVNGEHSLDVTTSRILSKGMRLLTLDATGAWREHVVTGEDAEHSGGRRPIGSYHAVWSIQYDLMGVPCTAMPGTQTPVTAASALQSLLSGTARWSRGTVTQGTTGGASMWRMSAWEALGVLVEVWGGEVEPTIAVDGKGVASRAVNLYSRQGSEAATRRFDYSRDLTSIRRVVAEDAMFVRVIPLGAAEETEGGGYGRKIDITSVNSGCEWLENADVKDLYKVPTGNDSDPWEYPTGYIENQDCSTPAALKAWALSVLDAYTAPRVTYEADAVQFARAGMDIQGLALGDSVDVVDRAFGDSGIRLRGRALRLVTDLLDPSDVKVTLGNLSDGLPDVFGRLDASIARVGDGLAATNSALYQTNQAVATTADYLNNLLENLNDEINVGGGYTYIVPGHGIVTYDVAVADPLVATEASRVTQLKGGIVRFANSKKAAFAGINDWNWRTLIVSGHIATELVTAGQITAGYIGSAASGNYWDLDNGTFQLAATSTVGGKAIATKDAVISSVDVQYAKGSSSTTAPTSGWSTTAPTWESGKYIWQRTKTVDQAGTASYSTPTCIQGAKGADGSPGTPGAAGADGDDGVGVSAIVEQYYLSTSNTTQAGGSWSTNQPAWSSGKYIWTRSKVTWTNGTTTYTDPVLAKAINGANQAAKDAGDAVDALDGELDQEEIFNRLTNNGEAQGIYLNSSDHKLYVNASYINSGTIKAARIGANSITAAKINATDLICPKVGNSADDFAQIGTFEHNGLTYSGIKFTIDGDNDTIAQGVNDSASGTRYIQTVGLPSGYGRWAFFDIAQNYLGITALPTLQGSGSSAYYSALSMIMDDLNGLQCYRGNGNWGWVQTISSAYKIRAVKNVLGMVMLYVYSPTTLAAGAFGSTVDLSGSAVIDVYKRPKYTLYQNVYCGGQCVIEVNASTGAVTLTRLEATVAADLSFVITYPRQ